MRLVHVVESLDVGGLEQMVLALASQQRAQGHEVQLVCLWHAGALAERARAQGLPVHSCDKRAGLDVGALWRLRGLLARAEADAVHTHNAMAHYYAAAALALLGRQGPAGRSRLVNTRHGMGGSRLAARGDRLYGWALRRTDAVACVASAACRQFVTQGLIPQALACVVPNGIALERFGPRSGAAGQALRAELGFAPQATLLGTVGRLSEVKQQHRLLPLLPALAHAGLPVALVVVGDGEERAALERAVSDQGLQAQVRLLGSRSDVPRLLAGMDMFVLPSRSEGYSLALVEAAAVGLPTVATDVGGNGEIVQHGITGLLVPADDDAALLAAVQSLVADASRRQAMGDAALAWAARHGSLQAMGESYLCLYRGEWPRSAQPDGGRPS